jgi:hypothetical protein
LHTIDLNFSNSGAYESVKTGGKRNVGRRAFADAKVFDENGMDRGSGAGAKEGSER